MQMRRMATAMAGRGVVVLIEFVRNLSSGACRKSPLWDAGKLLRRNCLSRPLTLKTSKVSGEPQILGAADCRYCWIWNERTTCSSESRASGSHMSRIKYIRVRC